MLDRVKVAALLVSHVLVAEELISMDTSATVIVVEEATTATAAGKAAVDLQVRECS